MPLAACRGSDPELFFPISATGRGLEETNAAKAVCRRCPVRQPCLSYALRTAPDGIWGGETREERSARRTRPAAGSRTDG
ncbi:MAG TPA: WhiB family transcriptional regulator [Trebonia sp.]